MDGRDWATAKPSRLCVALPPPVFPTGGNQLGTAAATSRPNHVRRRVPVAIAPVGHIACPQQAGRNRAAFHTAAPTAPGRRPARAAPNGHGARAVAAAWRSRSTSSPRAPARDARVRRPRFLPPPSRASSATACTCRSDRRPHCAARARRVSTPYPLESPFPLLTAHCTTYGYAHCIRSTPYSKEWRWKMPFNLAAPLCRVRSVKPQRLRYRALNGIFAPARSRQPTDSPPTAGLPDDSDSSRCLARALAPCQVCDDPQEAPGLGHRLN
jgi:hypothetical protein